MSEDFPILPIPNGPPTDEGHGSFVGFDSNTLPEQLCAQAEKYGPIFYTRDRGFDSGNMRPPEANDDRNVVVSDAGLIQTIFENPDIYNKKSIAMTARAGDALFFAADVAEEKQTYDAQKRMMLASFGHSQMEHYLDILLENADRCLENGYKMVQLPEHRSPGPGINLCDLATRFAFETVNLVGFKRGTGANNPQIPNRALDTCEAMNTAALAMDNAMHKPRGMFMTDSMQSLQWMFTDREGAAKSACSYAALENDNLHFMADVLEGMAAEEGIEFEPRKVKEGVDLFSFKENVDSLCQLSFPTFLKVITARGLTPPGPDKRLTPESEVVISRLKALRERLLIKRHQEKGDVNPKLSFFAQGTEQLGCPFPAGKGGTKKAALEGDIDGSSFAFKSISEVLFFDADPATGSYLTMENILFNFITFAIAGHDTTSGALSSLFLNIFQNPEIERKLTQEIREVIGFDGDLTWGKLGECTYLNRVIRENLRWASPSHMIVKDSPVDRDVILQSATNPRMRYKLEKGTTIMILQYALHHSKEIFGNPDVFDPDRYLPDRAAALPDFSWIPFSYGARGCIGMQLSLLEQRAFVVKFIQKFEGRISATGSRKMQFETVQFRVLQNLYMHFQRRVKSAHANTPLRLDAGTDASFEAVAGLNSKSVVVLYGSNMGSCHGHALKIVSYYRSLGFGNGFSYSLDESVEDSKIADVLPAKDEGLVIIATSTYNGLPPGNAEKFLDFMTGGGSSNHKLLSKVKNCRFSVLGCGNKQWVATYMEFASRVNQFFKDSGAIPLIDGADNFAKVDADAGDFESVFSGWTNASVQALAKVYREDIDKCGGLSPTFFKQVEALQHPPFPKYEVLLSLGKSIKDMDLGTMFAHLEMHEGPMMETLAKDSWALIVAENRELTDGKQDGRSVRHVECILPPEKTYQAGDHLNVCPSNPDVVVRDILQFYGIQPAATVRAEYDIGKQSGLTVPMGEKMPAYVLISHFWEFQDTATQLQLYHLSSYVPEDNEWRQKLLDCAKVDETGVALYNKEIRSQSYTVFELIKKIFATADGKPDLNSAPPIGHLLGMSPPMRPRLYSISSSPAYKKDRVSVSISVVEGKTPTGRDHIGLASNFLGKTYQQGRTLNLTLAEWEAVFEKWSNRLKAAGGEDVSGKALAKLVKNYVRSGFDIDQVQSAVLSREGKDLFKVILSEECDLEVNHYPADVFPSHSPFRQFILGWVMPNPGFKLPASKEIPVIMVGPGTGLAPMRGFLQQRVAEGGSGKNVMFFGCRDDGDFIYQQELEKYAADGALELHVAFSRKGKEKVYVQNKLRDAFQEDGFKDLLLKQGAHVYVCGDASSMAPAVKKTFEEFLTVEYVAKMDKEARYQVDVWAK